MKILLLSDPSNSHTIKWANSLYEKGIEIYLFGLSGFDSTQFYDGIKIDYLKTPSKIKSLSAGNFLKMYYLIALPKVKRIIKTFRPDIIHSHYATSYGLLGALCKFPLFYVTVWGSGDIFKFPRKSKIFNSIYRYILCKADTITTTSEVMRKEVSIYTEKKIHKIPFGVDTNVFKPTNVNSLFNTSDIVVGSIKALEPNYGLEYLLRAFKIVMDKLKSLQLKLLIVGGGSLFTILNKLANELQIQNNTVFTNRIPYKQISKYHNMIDISVFPSVMESFGVSVLEASACEKPVIVSAVGGLPEVVKVNETGFIVPSKNSDVLAVQLEKLILNRALRKNLGKNGRKFVIDNYEWNNCVSQMIDLYGKGI
jgi:glycosyltransferase involved in cell wall biosynthesis